MMRKEVKSSSRICVTGYFRFIQEDWHKRQKTINIPIKRKKNVFTSVHDLILVTPVNGFDKLVDVASHFIWGCTIWKFLQQLQHVLKGIVNDLKLNDFSRRSLTIHFLLHVFSFRVVWQLGSLCLDKSCCQSIRRDQAAYA